jgi:hypothetical protein
MSRRRLLLMPIGNLSVVGSIDLLSRLASTFRLLSNHVQCLDPDLEFLLSQVFINQLLFLVGDVGIPKIIDAGDGFQKLASALKSQLSLQGFKYPPIFVVSLRA